MDPTLAGFQQFVRVNMGIPVEVLPDDSPFIEQAFWLSMTLALSYLAVVGNAQPAPQTTPSYYAWAVYNLAGHYLVYGAMDDPSAPVDPDHPEYKTFWKDLRKSLGLNSFVPGVIQSSSDQGTSQSFMVPGWFSEMTMSDMELLRTPWGRTYMALAQAYGPTIWGLTY